MHKDIQADSVMQGSRQRAHFSEYMYFAGLQFRTAIFVLLLTVQTVAAAAQNTSQSSQNHASIHGVVLDSDGKPIASASVHLEQTDGSEAVTTTNDEGSFISASLRAGTYRIYAEKSGLSSKAVTASAQADDANITLVIETMDTTHNSSSSPDAMTFADKPNFTVAGITDWTAVGGHGSDATLRTSEALARETASLRPAGPESVASISSASESEGRLRAAVDQAPKSFDTNHQLGEYCLRKKSYREAIPPLSTAYQIDPTNYANEYDLALAYKGAGEFSQAREHIQKLLAHEEDADLHRLAGDVDEATGDSLSAVREYERAVQLDPSEQNYFAWGSELLLHRAVWPAAEVFRKGTAAYPKSERMLASLGAALFAGALYDEAALRLCDASDLNPDDPAPYIFLGKIDMAAPAALSCVEPRLKRFVEKQPGNAQANYYYAMAIWKRQQLPLSASDMQSVETLLNKAVAVDPKYGEAYLQLGILYSSVEHNFEKAIGFYQKAIEADPQLSDAHYRLGVTYERTGNSEKAKQQFQLHDEIEKQQAAAVERQRKEIKQFLVVLQDGTTPH